jgi:hypothetical protein
VYDQTDKSKDYRVKETSVHLEENRPLIDSGICHSQLEEKIHKHGHTTVCAYLTPDNQKNIANSKTPGLYKETAWIRIKENSNLVIQ